MSNWRDELPGFKEIVFAGVGICVGLVIAIGVLAHNLRESTPVQPELIFEDAEFRLFRIRLDNRSHVVAIPTKEKKKDE